jgi:hypothetical protein
MSAGGDLKHFNNVIGEYFFDIPLDNVSYTAILINYYAKVCIPGLHLSLGIFTLIGGILQRFGPEAGRMGQLQW